MLGKLKIQFPQQKTIIIKTDKQSSQVVSVFGLFGNDPSAGSPTETLLRLLLPLNDVVCPTFQQNKLPIRRPH